MKENINRAEKDGKAVYSVLNNHGEVLGTLSPREAYNLWIDIDGIGPLILQDVRDNEEPALEQCLYCYGMHPANTSEQCPLNPERR